MVDPGITWIEFQVFHTDEVKTVMSDAATSKIADSIIKLAEHCTVEGVNFFRLCKEAHIDRELFRLSEPKLREVFAAHAAERIQFLPSTESGLIELVRTQETIKYLGRKPGMGPKERMNLGALERKYEAKGRILQDEIGKRGLLSSLHDIFGAVFH
jgi:hypothetical protein